MYCKVLEKSNVEVSRQGILIHGLVKSVDLRVRVCLFGRFSWRTGCLNGIKRLGTGVLVILSFMFLVLVVTAILAVVMRVD